MDGRQQQGIQSSISSTHPNFHSSTPMPWKAQIPILFCLAAGPLWAQAPQRISFDRDIKPILSDRCYKCHGPDTNVRQADLRFDDRDTALAAVAESGLQVIDPSRPDDSELIRRIESVDPQDQMPPSDSKLLLSRQEIALLRRWIEQGAVWEAHWSFLPLAQVSVPQGQNLSWPRNPIDSFVLHRLEREGFTPTREAGRQRLTRRLSFDLTGLPPTLEKIDTVLADDSPQAYEKLVDRLLDRHEFGERMASIWLDVARYSDTYGYQVDRDRTVWPWRDWVVDAFNRNMPYDRFVTWQLAGDLMPNASDEQILATTFNRLHPQKVEGGSVPEEFRVEYVADRNHTFATAFMGLTLECSRCHAHKFDPISQQEYYQLFAFFNSIDEAGVYSYFTRSVPTPTLLLTDEQLKAKVSQVETRITEAEQALAALPEKRRDAFIRWLADRPKKPIVPGRIAHLDFESHEDGPNRSVEGRVGKAVKLSGDDAIGLEVGNFHRYEPFSIVLWMKIPEHKERAVIFHRSRAWTDAGSRGYQLLIEEGMLSASLIHFWPGNAVRVRTNQTVPVGKWINVAVTYDGSSRAEGLRIFVDGQAMVLQVVRDNLYKNITGGGGNHLAIGARFRDRGFTGGMVDEFEVFDRQLTTIEVAQLHDGRSLAEALVTPLNELTREQRRALLVYYLFTIDPENARQLAIVGAARKQRSELVDPISEIMVMRDLPEPRPTFLLERGAYDAPAHQVRPDTPKIFPAFGPRPENRLGLAGWLVDPSHPLTARVAVDRFWRMCFGRGLVGTPEDFGSQGKPPSHPKLLDWLARDFIEHDWDVKRLVKMMVMSATYRQDSTASSGLVASDPDNLLLGRAAVYRLPAEMIRDQALSVSGLLVRKVGGSPARPYELAVSFKPLAPDEGEGLYRRSLYTFWKRTAPAPVMMSLDASKRDICVVKRERTASPLQALVLLNDPQLLEAARVVGQRMVRRHGDDTDALVEEMFRLLISRLPSEKERDIITRLFQEQVEYFQEHEDLAGKFMETGKAPRVEDLAVARVAGAGVLASALMNFDEAVIRR